MSFRIGDLWTTALVILLWVGAAGWLLSTGTAPGDTAPGGEGLVDSLERNVAALMIDDGFYYHRIAQNLAIGEGSTFDGIHPTNGYHPLWLICLAAVAAVVRDATAALLMGFGLQVVLVAATAASLYRVARQGLAASAAVAAVLVWLILQCGYWPSLSGMEYALQTFLLVQLLLQATRLPDHRDLDIAEGFGLGALLSLAFLARLENSLLGALILTFMAVRSRGPKRWRGVLAASVPLLLTTLVYAGINHRIFGSPTPVSGSLKRDWSLDLLAEDPVYLESGWLAAKTAYLNWPLEHWPGTETLLLFLGTVGIAGALAIDRVGFRNHNLLPRSLRRALLPFVVFAVLQPILYIAIYHGGYSFQPWYFSLQGLLGALLVGAAVNLLVPSSSGGQRRSPLRRLSGLVVALALAGLIVKLAWNVDQERQRLDAFPQEPLFAAALWVDENLPAGTKVGAWNAGIVAHFSSARVVNLDGLVNSNEYRLSLRHDLCSYWRDEGIAYLADVFDRQDPFAQFAGQTSRCLDSLERVWEGPSYPGTTRGAAVYRLR